VWGRPDILWGLLAIAIPVALHLLQLRRYRKVAFSNVSFLKDVKKETQSRHRLRNLLVLLSRVLAFACVVLAFADPLLVPEDAASTGARQAVSVYVDTSPSMMASGESGPLIQEAKLKATALVEAFEETDQFHVFTSDFEGQDQRFVTRDEALERIASIQLGASAPGLDAVIRRGLDQLRRSDDATPLAFWISDLQVSSHAVEGLPTPDTAAVWHALPVVANAVPNVWIDSVWFDAPIALAQRPAALHVRIAHDAAEGVDALPLNVTLDGVTAAIGSFNVVPGLPTDTVLRFTHGDPGPHHVSVSLSDAPVQFDDVKHLGYRVESAVEVFHWVDDLDLPSPQCVDRAYQSAGDMIRVDRGTSLPPAQTLDAFDLIVFDGVQRPSLGALAMLRDFHVGGGTVVVVPDSSGNGVKAWFEAFELPPPSGWHRQAGQVANLRWNHPLFKGVFRDVPQNIDWPTYDRTLDRRKLPTEEVLATTAHGAPYLSVLRAPKAEQVRQPGDVYVLASPLETGNLTRHGLFVPLLLRIAEQARNTQIQHLVLGRDVSTTLALAEDSTTSRLADIQWELRPFSRSNDPLNASQGRPQGPARVVPEARSSPEGTRLGWGSNVETPGLYTVLRNGTPVAALGFNHAREESLLEAWVAEEWAQAMESAGWTDLRMWTQPSDQLPSLVETHVAGHQLAWYFFAAAFAALAFETILLRRWNKLFS